MAAADALMYILPTYFLNFEHPEVQEFVAKNTSHEQTKEENLIALYYAIRDGFRYNPYHLDLRPEAMQASHLVQRTAGYCIEKAALLAACARSIGIPSRLGFANVRNHIGTEKIEDFLKTDVLVFHGYADLFVNGQWRKATPAFNKQLCEILNVLPLEFDAKEDSVFQEFDKKGGRYMEYLHDYGTYHDIPHDLFINSLKTYYPHLFDHATKFENGDFLLSFDKES